MRAKLLRLYSPDADPIEQYLPDGSFGLLVTAFVGPEDGPGEESFDFMLCTPDWFERKMMTRPHVSGRHTVFVRRFDYVALEHYVRDYCSKCEGSSWREVAEKVARLGAWEFEDYDAPPIRP